ncbi:MAG: MATE family efflux transporter, partial [Eubacteriales bacterium]|nr:MATE family efflux transporter [Eubacteriales bacterium]
ISVSFNTSLLKYGGDIAVGAMTILSSINMFAMLPLQGLGQGAQPIVSYNYGAKDAKRVRGAFRLLLKSSLIYATALWLIIMLLPQVFTSIFTPNAELAAFTQSAMRRYFAVMFMFGIQIACQMTFTAIGSAKSSIAVAVVRKFVLLLPLIYLMPALFPADKAMAVYLAEPAADFIAVTFTAILFSIQFKRAMDKLPNS